MPPGKPLDAQSVAALREWIDQGALWPDSAPGAAQPAWWSFQKIVKPPVPRSESTWARNDIDRFLEAGFRKQALKPATEAGRAALIRRLSYGLHGLPATADEAAAFEKDTASDAYEKLVDRLLASPRYGEKAGRFWLDLARYSDTAGFELDTYIADAWRYRDYVIQSFNDDKPYNRFIREQIAGDEMFRDDPAAQTGTGYFCVGPNRDGFPDQADINRVEVLTDFVDTTSSVFLGLSAGCARCHDHKYDPIPQRDYFRMQAIFAPFVKTRVPLNRLNSLFWDVSENIREIKLREIGEELTAIQSPCRNKLYQARLAAIPADAARAIQTEDAKRTPEQEVLTRKYESEVRVSNDEIRGCLSPEKAAELHAIEKRLVAMFSGYRSKPFACGVTDMSDVSPRTYMPVRGAAKGTEVFPGFFSALGGGDVSLEPPELPTSTGPIPYQPTTGRRKALAEWLTKPDHPLTPRVIANRIWQFHFGKGIVATPNDFGRRGADMQPGVV